LPLRRTLAPTASMHANVLAQSAELEKFSNSDVPSAIPANIPYRCETDLSPAVRTLPRICFAALTFTSIGSVLVFVRRS
jgi:hypothetical protein